MKKYALFLNTSEIGGAERSLIRQFELAEKISAAIFFIPNLGEKKAYDFLINKNYAVENFNFPSALYKISRQSNPLTWPFALLSSLFKSDHEQIIKKISEKDLIYLNGNKVGIYICLLCFYAKNKSQIIWHFRDYSPKNTLWRLILRCFFRFILNKINLKFVANSKSVAKDWEVLTSKKVTPIYNPVDDFEFKKDRSVQILGSASMLAPWKGVHEILICVKTYEKELKDLGIKKIKIFGDNIYKTNGPHQKYVHQLQALKSDLIEFCGNQPPAKIFAEIDILIHSSLKPEPFGRIITEAYKSGTSVITTGLGGASELVHNSFQEKCAETYAAGNTFELFNKIAQLITDKTLRVTLKNRALICVTEIEKNLPHDFSEILEKNEQQNESKQRS